MHQKMHGQPAVARRLSRTQASLETASPEDTDFEEDVSDEGEEEYDGRRSEDSVSQLFLRHVASKGTNQ
jgi:hypothetical protein